MSGKKEKGIGSRRWPKFLGALMASLLLLVIVPSFCIIRDAGTGVLGVVLTAEGQPIEGARAELRVPRGGRSDSLFVAESSITDPEGCFGLFSFHQPGTVEISVMADGFRKFQATAPQGSYSVEVVLVPLGTTGSSRGRLAPSSSDAEIQGRCREYQESVDGSDTS